MNVSGKGVLSDLYKDLTTTDHIRTFSYPMNEQLYVFMDIGFSFLYEHPYLSV
ncbi:hypothetical protein JCM19039_695 [Geomicrobium sp. JCM 19039]|nr:hypothetical protein JCM19039_695 [Geomicrobium sp. JCM 19039]